MQADDSRYILDIATTNVWQGCEDDNSIIFMLKTLLDSVDDEQLLVEIVLNSIAFPVSEKALSKINTPKALAQIAMSSIRWLNVEAIERISDRETLMYIAKESKAGSGAEFRALRQLGLENDEEMKQKIKEYKEEEKN